MARAPKITVHDVIRNIDIQVSQNTYNRFKGDATKISLNAFKDRNRHRDTEKQLTTEQINEAAEKGNFEGLNRWENIWTDINPRNKTTNQQANADKMKSVINEAIENGYKPDLEKDYYKIFREAQDYMDNIILDNPELFDDFDYDYFDLENSDFFDDDF